jgi:hypothetical protein
MFSWTLRIAGWIVGIYALLKLASATGTVTYTKVFQAWMNSLRDIVDLGFLLTPLKMAVILPALDFIRSFDIPIPPLQDHWQQVFVLTWLLSAAWTRNLSESNSTPVALVAAFFITLPFCVAAGTMPVDSAAILAWPFAGFLAFLTVLVLLGNESTQRIPILVYNARGKLVTIVHQLKWPLFASFTAAFTAAGYFFGTNQDLPQLVLLAGFVGLIGLLLLTAGMFMRIYLRRAQNPEFGTGLDITATMLGAFGLATVFADPPLF